MVVLAGIPNAEYYLGGLGLVIAVIVIWRIISRSSGRLGEERQEERETRELEGDERINEKIQKDEKKQCRTLDNLFSDIMIILRNSGNKVLADNLSSTRQQISLILLREISERMSVKTALQTFKELHALINEFLAKLSNDNQQINVLVEEIKKHQLSYYQNIVRELEIDEKKKKTLQKLWTQVLDEEAGRGQLAA